MKRLPIDLLMCLVWKEGEMEKIIGFSDYKTHEPRG